MSTEEEEEENIDEVSNDVLKVSQRAYKLVITAYDILECMEIIERISDYMKCCENEKHLHNYLVNEMYHHYYGILAVKIKFQDPYFEVGQTNKFIKTYSWLGQTLIYPKTGYVKLDLNFRMSGEVYQVECCILTLVDAETIKERFENVCIKYSKSDEDFDTTEFLTRLRAEFTIDSTIFTVFVKTEKSIIINLTPQSIWKTIGKEYLTRYEEFTLNVRQSQLCAESVNCYRSFKIKTFYGPIFNVEHMIESVEVVNSMTIPNKPLIENNKKLQEISDEIVLQPNSKRICQFHVNRYLVFCVTQENLVDIEPIMSLKSDTNLLISGYKKEFTHSFQSVGDFEEKMSDLKQVKLKMTVVNIHNMVYALINDEKYLSKFYSAGRSLQAGQMTLMPHSKEEPKVYVSRIFTTSKIHKTLAKGPYTFIFSIDNVKNFNYINKVVNTFSLARSKEVLSNEITSLGIEDCIVYFEDEIIFSKKPTHFVDNIAVKTLFNERAMLDDPSDKLIFKSVTYNGSSFVLLLERFIDTETLLKAVQDFKINKNHDYFFRHLAVKGIAEYHKKELLCIQVNLHQNKSMQTLTMFQHYVTTLYTNFVYDAYGVLINKGESDCLAKQTIDMDFSHELFIINPWKVVFFTQLPLNEEAVASSYKVLKEFFKSNQHDSSMKDEKVNQFLQNAIAERSELADEMKLVLFIYKDKLVYVIKGFREDATD